LDILLGGISRIRLPDLPGCTDFVELEIEIDFEVDDALEKLLNDKLIYEENQKYFAVENETVRRRIQQQLLDLADDQYSSSSSVPKSLL